MSDFTIKTQVGPVVRHEATGRNHDEPTRVTLPRVDALADVEDEPRQIRFVPTVQRVDPIKLRNLETIRRVGRMLARAGEGRTANG